MILVRETQGATLIGVIDGTNKTFTTSQVMDASFVNVFFNGLLLLPGSTNGYGISGNQVIFAQPPQVGDTVEVEYRIPGGDSGGGGGGADGGIPPPAESTNLRPQAGPFQQVAGATIQAQQDKPGASATNLRPQVLTRNLKPSIL